MKIKMKIMLGVVIAALIPAALIATYSVLSMQAMNVHATEKLKSELKDAQTEKFQAYTGSEAEKIDLLFSAYYKDTKLLQEYGNHIYNNYSQFKDAYHPDYYPDKNHSGLPGFGYIHPEYGIYADWEHRGIGNPYLSASIVRETFNNTTYQAYVSEELHKVMLFDSIFPEVYNKHNDTADLVWVLRLGGFSNCYPWFSYEEVLVENPDYDNISDDEQDYVVLANPENNPGRDVIWLPPYLDPTKGVWMTSCIAPLYLNDSFIGTVGIDIILKTLVDYTASINYGNDSYAFLVSEDGTVLAMSERGIDEILWNETHKRALREILKPAGEQNWTQEMQDAIENIKINETPNQDIARIFNLVLQGNTGYSSANLNGKEVVFSYAPVNSTKWHLVTVCPTSTLVKIAEESEKELNAYIAETTLIYESLLVIFLICGAFAGLVIMYSVISPFTKALTELRSVVDEISKGNLSAKIKLRTEEPIISEIIKAFERLQNTALVAMKELEAREGEKNEDTKRNH